MTIRTTVTTLLVVLYAVATTNAAANTPARFSTGEHGLAKLIKFPETRGDGKITLRCAAKVGNDGDLNDNGCYGDNSGANLFIAAINKAAKKARMTPAEIDGQHRSVYLQYQVEFTTKGDEKTVTVYNNPGVLENIDAYGVDHIAAQRSITREKWQKVCPQHVRFLVWVKAHVAASGEPSSISIASNDGPPITQNCEHSIIDTMNAAGFVPAMADGEAVPSTYVEPFGN